MYNWCRDGNIWVMLGLTVSSVCCAFVGYNVAFAVVCQTMDLVSKLGRRSAWCCVAGSHWL